MMEIKPFKIRNIEINPPLILSPMAGVTDISFRRLLKQRGGVGLTVSEFISVEGLTRNNPKSKRQMRFYENERPFAVQIFGGQAERMRMAAEMAEEVGADILDVNCGCPAPKVVKHGGGSGLLRDLPRQEGPVWSVAVQLVTLRAEAAAVHARWFPARSADYGVETRARLQLGHLVSGADYLLAQRLRQRLRDELRSVFEEVDVLAVPAVPLVAPRVGQPRVRWRNRQEPVDAALVRFTAPFNLTGAPALSVPCGLSQGLPVGIQLVGRWNDEATILAAGQAVEDRVGRLGRPFE